MATNSQQQKGRDGALSTLNVAIEAMNLAREVSSVAPAKAVFNSQYPPHDDQGRLALPLRPDGPCLHITRTDQQAGLR